MYSMETQLIKLKECLECGGQGIVNKEDAFTDEYDHTEDEHGQTVCMFCEGVGQVEEETGLNVYDVEGKN